MTPVSFKFIASSALIASKTAVYRMKPTRPSDQLLGDATERQGVIGTTSIGVNPSVAQGRYYQTDLSMGTTEQASDLLITDAVCSISKVKNIVRTALVGLSGTIKEYITEGDYDLTITVGLVAIKDGRIVDEYPEEGVRKLRELLDTGEALFVRSDFLQLFDVTRVVVLDYSFQQMTHGNYQAVTIKALSDDDYVIRNNEY